MGGDLITYAHSQLRVMLNPAALAQMTQNNTEQNVKENRTQNNTAKKITWVPKYIWNSQQSTQNWMVIMFLWVLCTMRSPRGVNTMKMKIQDNHATEKSTKQCLHRSGVMLTYKPPWPSALSIKKKSLQWQTLTVQNRDTIWVID